MAAFSQTLPVFCGRIEYQGRHLTVYQPLSGIQQPAPFTKRYTEEAVQVIPWQIGPASDILKP